MNADRKADPFDNASLSAALTAAGLALPCMALAETDSTNDDAKRRLRAGGKTPFLIAANAQRAGRGRGEHLFHSPAGTGLYMSLAVPLPAEDAVTLVTPLAAVAVCRAVSRTAGVELQIKWVNDLFLGGKKVCGILSERVENAVVVGIGVNVRRAAFPAELTDIAGALESDVKRTTLAAAIVKEVLALLDSLPDLGFLSEYRARSLLLGREIAFSRNGTAYTARAVAVDDRAGLTVQHADGHIETLTSGEVSVRV